MPPYSNDTARTIGTLSVQVLAGIAAAPQQHARQILDVLEPEDFPNWIHQTIFAALGRVDFAPHPAPGSVVTQLNADLLAAGKYADHDNGLRSAVNALATTTGHPEQIHAFANELIEWRFRTAVANWGAGLEEKADTAPLKDLETNLARIDELRLLYARIARPNHLKPLKRAA